MIKFFFNNFVKVTIRIQGGSMLIYTMQRADDKREARILLDF